MIGSRTGNTQRMIEDLLVARDQAAATGEPFRAYVIAANVAQKIELERRIRDAGGPSVRRDRSEIGVYALAEMADLGFDVRAQIWVDDHAWEIAGPGCRSELADLIERCQ